MDSRSHRDRGATAAEYAIIIALIAGVIASAVFLVGQDAIASFNSVVGRF